MMRSAAAFVSTALATGFLTFGLAAVDVAPLPVLILFLCTGFFLMQVRGLERLLPSGLTLYATSFVAALLASVTPSPSPRVEAARTATVTVLLLAAALAGLCYSRAAKGKAATATWLAVGFAMGVVIAFVSSDVGSADPMRAWFMRYLSPGQAEVAVWLVRKSIHVGYYGTFAWVLLRATRASNSWLPAVVVPLGHGVFDEFRQLTDSRTRLGSPVDVVFDLTGILVAVTIAGGFRRRAKPRAQME